MASAAPAQKAMEIKTVKIAIESPYTKKLIFIGYLPNINCQDLVVMQQYACDALSVVKGERDFTAYHIDELGLHGVRCLALCTASSAENIETVSRVSGMYGAILFINMLERQYIMPQVNMQRSSFDNEVQVLLKTGGLWALDYASKYFLDPEYRPSIHKDRAKKIGSLILDKLTVEKKQREDRRAAERASAVAAAASAAVSAPVATQVAPAPTTAPTPAPIPTQPTPAPAPAPIPTQPTPAPAPITAPVVDQQTKAALIVPSIVVDAPPKTEFVPISSPPSDNAPKTKFNLVPAEDASNSAV